MSEKRQLGPTRNPQYSMSRQPSYRAISFHHLGSPEIKGAAERSRLIVSRKISFIGRRYHSDMYGTVRK